jgi:nucleotide-binding universal stress UspA family protein
MDMKGHISTILVPLDGSSFAEWALPYAIDAAGKLNSAIELLGVSSRRNVLWQSRVETDYPEDADVGDGGASEYLRRTAQKIEAVSPAQVLCTVLFGSAPDAIVSHASANRPQLVVLTSHGRGPMSRVWLGSVADRVLRNVSMPVMLVRPREGAEPDLEAKISLRRILVALDGSPQAETSLHWAKRLGTPETSYTLVRVEPLRAPVWTADPESAPFYVRDYSKSAHHAAVEYLDGVVRRAMNGTEHVGCVVKEGLPAAAGILKAADENSADLVAITTHARGRLPNLILGSVTDKVIRASSLPVLIVRRQSAESEEPAETVVACVQNASRPSSHQPTRRRSDDSSFEPSNPTEVQWRL